MEVNNRAASLAVKAQDPPRFACAEKNLAVAHGEVDEVQVKMPLFDPSTGVTKLLATEARRGYLTGEPVFSEGEPANAVLYVQCGGVRLTARSADGEQAVICVLQEGSFFGECCLSGQTFRSATASAVLPSVIVRIEKQSTLDLLHSDPEFADRFLNYTLSRSILMEANLIDYFFDSSFEPLAQIQAMKANIGSE
jgi:CRP-like cAMP-binding protein